MPCLNEIRIMGHVGRVPELRTTSGGISVCNFSVATTEKFGEREHTEWHEVTAWKGWADVAAKTLTVGALVYVEGRIETQEWEKDGEKRRKVIVQASKVFYLRDANKRGAPKQQPAAQTTTSGDDEELPF